MFVIAVLILCVLGFFVYEYWRYKATDHGAPYVALDPDLVERVLRIGHVGENDILYDLGSGDGRIPITAALHFNCRAVGIEIDKLRYYYSLYQVFLLRLSERVKFYNKNFFDINLSEASVVVLYLLQDTNELLMDKLVKELKPGTRIISCAFNFPNWKPIFVDDEEHRTPYGPIYLYVIGESNLPKAAPQPITKPTTNPTVASQ